VPDKIGRYEIERELGRGGMAMVYLAHDPLMDRQVAVKVLPRQFTFDPNFRSRFQREAKIIARLEHPAIVPVYDFGEYDDQPYLVMRYMAGGSLRQRLKDGPLPLDEVARLYGRLAPALDKAHRQNIIHRDLKPDNVLFDDEGLPYLADFGIARLAEASQTMTVAGTPAYMSPEQVHGKRQIDGRSDIYALGAMLFELLAGRPPYAADTNAQLMFKHAYEPVPDVRQANPALPAAAQTVIERAMAKEPTTATARPASWSPPFAS
jgi:eukaryotic-like serine/threonine-protein kinase